jgi:hypothetical protein
MSIQTGNTCTARPVLRVTDQATFIDSDAVLYITDLAFSGENSVATYNTVDQCATLKFPTTTNRTMSITVLRDSAVYGKLDGYFTANTEINWELSPIGTAVGNPFKTGKAYVTTLNESKTGTNIWEIQITFEINGDISAGTH